MQRRGHPFGLRKDVLHAQARERHRATNANTFTCRLLGEEFTNVTFPRSRCKRTITEIGPAALTSFGVRGTHLCGAMPLNPHSGRRVREDQDFRIGQRPSVRATRHECICSRQAAASAAQHRLSKACAAAFLPGRTASTQRAWPNQSLEPTCNHMGPWPRGAVLYSAPRGQGPMRSQAAQLQR